ncbi:hypothetical protein B0T22DRAFT_483437 [Podospora appendiculata]|uniref:Myocyte-specific enhancer factor 2d n=1 Tax=Podospora appendiculata TaxID=314037 RepID=A0AAE0X2M5_9PEZI|nr:hypothetical protein B0T22DRAFT_483437 [Podospora appendiculata]
MNRDIPGFYYDDEKRKYFRIEDGKTAPAQAQWSAETVKRRQAERLEDEAQRANLARHAGRIKHAGLLSDALTGGFLVREMGQPSAQTPVVCWAQGLQEKGEISLWPTTPPSVGSLSLMYIGNRDVRTGLGVAYGVLKDEYLASAYIPRDDDDEINYRDAEANHGYVNFGAAYEAIHAPQLSSIKYHEPSHKILLTSRRPTRKAGIAFFSPRQSDFDDDTPPALRLGETGAVVHVTVPTPSNTDQVVHTCAPGLAASNVTAVVGTDLGLLTLHNDRLRRLTPMNDRPHQKYIPVSGEVNSLDFLTADVVLCAGRSSQIHLVDIRAPWHEWPYLSHPSPAVTHVRSLGDGNQVLAAGPHSTMCVYDIRFAARRVSKVPRPPSSGKSTTNRWDIKPLESRRVRPEDKNGTLPVVTFPAYRNEARRFGIGLDVLSEYGVVCAAHDDGSVALYSLRDGSRLRAEPVDKIAAKPEGAVVKSLMFQTLPGDTHPSLFVGEGTRIKKYSFGVRTWKRKRGGGEGWGDCWEE